MATVISFVPRKTARVDDPAVRAPAAIIIFPGVRYDSRRILDRNGFAPPDLTAHVEEPARPAY